MVPDNCLLGFISMATKHDSNNLAPQKHLRTMSFDTVGLVIRSVKTRPRYDL